MLFPTALPDAETIETIPAAAPSYPTRTWALDLDAGEFLLTPRGGVLTTSDALSTFTSWAEKAVRTARYRYRAYTPGYGSELPLLIGQGLPRPIAEREIERMIRECLEADARTAAVRDLTITWAEDAAWVTCTLVSVWGRETTITEAVL